MGGLGGEFSSGNGGSVSSRLLAPSLSLFSEALCQWIHAHAHTQWPSLQRRSSQQQPAHAHGPEWGWGGSGRVRVESPSPQPSPPFSRPTRRADEVLGTTAGRRAVSNHGAEQQVVGPELPTDDNNCCDGRRDQGPPTHFPICPQAPLRLVQEAGRLFLGLSLLLQPQLQGHAHMSPLSATPTPTTHFPTTPTTASESGTTSSHNPSPSSQRRRRSRSLQRLFIHEHNNKSAQGSSILISEY